MNRAKKEVINNLTYKGARNSEQCLCGDYTVNGWCPNCKMIVPTVKPLRCEGCGSTKVSFQFKGKNYCSKLCLHNKLDKEKHCQFCWKEFVPVGGEEFCCSKCSELWYKEKEEREMRKMLDRKLRKVVA